MEFLKKYAGVLALVAIVIAIGAYAFPKGGDSVGAGTRFPNGISADTTSPVAGEIRGDDLTLDDDAVITDDLTINGRSLTVTSSNAATSSVLVGCIEMAPTSTASKVVLEFHASSSLANSTNGTTQGLVTWDFGTCPI